MVILGNNKIKYYLPKNQQTLVIKVSKIFRRIMR